MENIHWKKTCNVNYLGSWDLANVDGTYGKLTLTIKNIKQEEVLEPSTNKKSIETVIEFKENYKPMILNSTNKKTIAKVSNSNFVNDWIGKKITIQVEKVKAFGDVHDALRVSKVPPAVETIACEVCGKQIDVSLFNGIKTKHGVGACSKECLDKFKEENADASEN